MKKIFLTLSVCAIVALASCKKDHTCSCTSSSSAGGTATTQDITIVKAKKGDAKKRCVKTTQTSTGSNPVTTTTDCKLK